MLQYHDKSVCCGSVVAQDYRVIAKLLRVISVVSASFTPSGEVEPFWNLSKCISKHQFKLSHLVNEQMGD